MAKTVLVTGSTDGIGRATALELARRGHRVLVHGRDASRVDAALRGVREAGARHADGFLADFSAMSNVRKLAEEVTGRIGALDVLVNNAGVYMPRLELSDDGLEMTFAVNHLAPFLLTGLLLPALRAAAPARVVTVASVTHRSALFDLTGATGEGRYDGHRAYALSKLANVMFALELAERLDPAEITSNVLHPGGIATKLLRAGFGGGGASPEKGARTPVYLAVSPEVEGASGLYYERERPVSAAPEAYDRGLRARLWDLSERLTGFVWTDVSKPS